MKKIIYLVIALLMIGTLSAQNKNLTLYYPDSTRVINISGLDSMIIFICGASKVSYGGKDYNTVLIGSQCWLKENLDVGTMIQNNQVPTNNDIIEKWCYQNVLSNCSALGGLYSWYETMKYMDSNGGQGICPEGWHIPTVDEFLILKAAVNNDGNSLKREDQGIGSGVGTNTSGFSALLAGYKDGSNSSGGFGSLGLECFIWSSTSYNSNFSNYLFIPYYDNQIYVFNGHYKNSGLSVRCIKNN